MSTPKRKSTKRTAAGRARPAARTGGRVERALEKMGLRLPAPGAPLANYVGAVVSGKLVFVSGHGPLRDGRVVYGGKLGRDLTTEQGYEAAQFVMLNCLASLRAAIGSLDRVRRVVKLLGMVNGTPEFAEQPQVINGASDLLVKIFGDRGRHARSAVGMGSLPLGIAVEIEMIVEIR
ncbi:MAG TPA: RidA family protein [bacterium]|nr:RidA family protein [bacterium]